MNEKQIAKQAGTTVAGLKFLAKMDAKGAAPQRGNEVSRLEKDGLIASVPDHRWGNWESRPFTITEAGRNAVRTARSLGW